MICASISHSGILAVLNIPRIKLLVCKSTVQDGTSQSADLSPHRQKRQTHRFIPTALFSEELPPPYFAAKVAVFSLIHASNPSTPKCGWERRTTDIDWPTAGARGGVTSASAVVAIHAQINTDSGEGNEDIFIL